MEIIWYDRQVVPVSPSRIRIWSEKFAPSWGAEVSCCARPSFLPFSPPGIDCNARRGHREGR